MSFRKEDVTIHAYREVGGRPHFPAFTSYRIHMSVTIFVSHPCIFNYGGPFPLLSRWTYHEVSCHPPDSVHRLFFYCSDVTSKYMTTLTFARVDLNRPRPTFGLLPARLPKIPPESFHGPSQGLQWGPCCADV